MNSLRLKEITSKIGSGATPSGGQNTYHDTGISFIRSQNVHDFHFSKKGLAFINEEQASELNNVQVQENDILLNITGDSIARVCMVMSNILPARVNQHVSIIRVNSLVNSKYLLCYLVNLKAYLLKICRVGGTRNALTKDTLEKLVIKFPELAIQEKIGFLISNFNSKIELNNRINAELEAMAKTLYDYWFVQFDFPDKNGKPYKSTGGKMVWNNELKREIPEGWNSAYIGDLLSSESFKKKIPTSEILPKGQIPVIDQSTEYIAGFTNDIDSVIRSTQPRIVFGDHTRILKFINFDFARGADGTQVLLSNSKRMPQHVFFHTVSKIDLSNYGYARHFKFLKEMRIILPDEKVSNLFDKTIESNYKMIRDTIFQNLQLTELRDWLLPMLMNGQVKVSEL